MFHFSFAKATAVLTLFFSFALGWVSYRYYLVQSRLEHFYRKEEAGIAKADQIIKQFLIVSTQFRPTKEQVNSNIQLIEKIRKELSDSGIFKGDENAAIVDSQDTNPFTGSDSHTQVTTLKRYLRLVLDHSNLILDPSFQTYYLVDNMFSALPDVFYGKMSWGETYWNLGHADATAAHQEIGAREASVHHYMESFSKALRTSSAFISDDALKDMESFRQASARFEENTLQLLEQLRRGDSHMVFSMSAFEKNLASLRQEALQTIQSGIKLFSDLNGRRIEKSHFESLLSLGVSLFLWLLSIVFMAVIIRAVLQSEATMNSLILKQKEALEKAQKLATLGEVSSSIGHEIANPLMVIKGTTDLLEEHFGQIPDVKKYSSRIKKMVDRIDSIIRSMKFFLNSHEEPSGRAVVNLNIVISEAHEQLRHRIANARIDLQFNGFNTDPSLVWGNEEDLIQVFTNLIGNAIDAIKGQKEKLIVISLMKRDKQLCVCIQDNGNGVRPENREKIFEALFTTKPPNEGTGLGLSIAKKILAKYEGQLHLIDSEGMGAKFEVVLSQCMISPEKPLQSLIS